MKKTILFLSSIVLAGAACAAPNKNNLGSPNGTEIKKVEAALPAKAPARPSKDRKILVVSRCEGFVHKSIPLGVAAIRLMGEKTGAYSIEETREMTAFTAKNLAQFDAILFLSTTHLDPSPEQREALLDFVRGGKGIIGIHAASDTFYSWEAGAKMIGGLFCGHPWTANCTVKIKLDEPDHPINECFHGESFNITDEIYQFKDPYSRKTLRVLTSLDLSDPDTLAVKGGHPGKMVRTDNDFGITWIHPEGQGRVFYCSLGHNPHIFWDARILQHYLAGIQYAVGDYSVPDQILPPPTLPFDAIRTLTPTNGQETLRPIEAQIFNASLDNLPAIEAGLLKIFQSPETTLEGKRYCCRMLRFCASEACVPVLAPQLINPELSSFVRMVFQGLETPAADKALAKALPRVDPALKIGIIGTLGQRRSPKSTQAIKPYLTSTDRQIQLAAITALGNLGGVDATKALASTKVAPELSNDWKRAQLKCAATLDAKTATRIYQKFLVADHDDPIRAEALAEWVSLNPQEAAPAVLFLFLLDDARLKKTAIGLLPSLPTDQLLLAGKNAEDENRSLIINALSGRKDPLVESFALSMLSDTNAVVQTAAFAALGNIGGVDSIGILVAAAPHNAAAFDALCRLRTKGTDAEMIQTLESCNDDQVAEKLIECLALRQSHATLSSIVTFAEGSWSRTTKTAIDALAALVRTEEFGLYARLIMEATEQKKMVDLEKSATLASQRQPDANACALRLIGASKGATGEAEYAILRTLGSIGGPAAHGLLTQSLDSPDPQIIDAAIRGLAHWPTLDAAAQLLELATTAESEKHRVIALRGYIRLAGTQNDPVKNLEMCRKAAEATDRPAELISIIGCAKRNRNEPVLEFLAQQLDNPEVFTEAAWAICEMAKKQKIGQASIPVLERIAATATDERLINEVQATRERVGRQAGK